jgi:hypothetical protein
MKHHELSQDPIRKQASASRLTTAANLSPIGIDFTPSADEVARRTSLSYGNQPLLPDHAVQHWFEAEAQLLKERYLTWVYGFHNRA